MHIPSLVSLNKKLLTAFLIYEYNSFYRKKLQHDRALSNHESDNTTAVHTPQSTLNFNCSIIVCILRQSHFVCTCPINHQLISSSPPSPSSLSSFPSSFPSSLPLPNVLEVVREVGHGAAAVHLLAGGAVGFGHGSRAAAEHADFADLQSEKRQ